MEQNHLWPNQNQRRTQPPLVSGSELRRNRTGVAFSCSGSGQGQSMPRSSMTERCAGTESCRTDATGILPDCAPLANPYVPFQRTNPQRYPTQRALSRGTLYPGLDLPLYGMVNTDMKKTPMTQLMALEFAVIELGMYLDTHPDDCEAAALFRDYAQQAAEARAAYEAKHGPLRLGSAGAGGSWDWICDPWPWDFCQEG